MSRMRPCCPMPGLSVIADIKLQSEIVAKRNHAVEHTIISYNPWCNHKKESGGRGEPGHNPIAAAPGPPVPNPSPDERQDRDYDRITQCCNPAENAEAHPFTKLRTL